MNSQERAQEPSMDEILASIRRIIAEEPASSRQQQSPASAVVPLPANPLFKPAAPPAAQKAAATEPTFGRLAEALRGPSPAPASQAPANVPASGIDDDLADLLREPIAATGPANTPPPAPADGKPKENWAMWRSAPAPSESRPFDRAATAKPPQFIPPTPVKAPLAKTQPQPPAEPAQAATADLGALGPRRDESRSAPASNGTILPERKLPSFDAAFPPMTNGNAQKSAADAKPEAASPATQHAEPPKTSSGPVVIAAMPLVPPAAAAAPAQAHPVETRVPEQDKKTAALGEQPGKIEASVPLPPRQIAIGPSVSVEADAGPAPAAQAIADDIAKTEAETSAAAASALGALAAGLAVASAHSAVEPAGQSQQEPDVPPSAVVEQPKAAAAAPVAAVQAAVAADANAASQAAPASTPAASTVRTLEDAVADMLRPMLQQWLTDNMPRIVEKALKIETGHVSVAVPGDKSKS